MTATDTELDDILSGSPLQILGRICKCNEAEKIGADFPKETSTSVTLDGDVFCVRDFLADAVLKRQKAVLRYLAGRDLTENTVSYLCMEHNKVSRLVYLNAWSAKEINALAEKDLFSVFDEYGNTIQDLAKKFGKEHAIYISGDPDAATYLRDAKRSLPETDNLLYPVKPSAFRRSVQKDQSVCKILQTSTG